MNKIPSNYVYVLYLNFDVKFAIGVFDTIDEAAEFLNLSFDRLWKASRRNSLIQCMYKLKKVQIYDWHIILVDKDDEHIDFYKARTLNELSALSGINRACLYSAIRDGCIIQDKYKIIIRDEIDLS